MPRWTPDQEKAINLDKKNILVSAAAGSGKTAVLVERVVSHLLRNPRTEEDAWEAAELAGIAEDIRDLPMGMHTMISEGAGGISGGQKQRLMIARAVAAKPKILMLDEATSALDNLTQKKISESLDKLKCTRIVIAHRLSTIRH